MMDSVTNIRGPGGGIEPPFPQFRELLDLLGIHIGCMRSEFSSRPQY